MGPMKPRQPATNNGRVPIPTRKGRDESGINDLPDREGFLFHGRITPYSVME